MQNKTLMVMAGGTGGHIFPALAVAKLWREAGGKVVWLGTAAGLETRLVPQNNIPLHLLGISGVRGKSFLTRLLAPFNLLRAIWQAMQILRAQKPDIVMGMGGYAAAPGGFAAWLLRIPVVIHEQNAAAGLTNRLLAPFARHVLTGFPNVFPRGKWLGNPVRADIFNVNEILDSKSIISIQLKSQTVNILVLGGSQGALALNERVPAALAHLRDLNLSIKHQSGKSLPQAQEHYRQNEVSGEVIDFIEDMAAAYAWANVIICRAGALTVAELAAAGVPAILVPLPSAVDDHQTKNAASLATVGGGVLLAQADARPEKLAAILRELVEHPDKLQAMQIAVRTQATPHAAQDIYQILVNNI